MPPDYLVDRNIGTSVVATRAARLTVHTLADIYGHERSQEVTDPEWISLAGQRGFVALTKDKRIRHRPAESEAVLVAKVHLFALVAGNANLRETAGHSLRPSRGWLRSRMAKVAGSSGSCIGMAGLSGSGRWNDVGRAVDPGLLALGNATLIGVEVRSGSLPVTSLLTLFARMADLGRTAEA